MKSEFSRKVLMFVVLFVMGGVVGIPISQVIEKRKDKAEEIRQNSCHRLKQESSDLFREREQMFDEIARASVYLNRAARNKIAEDQERGPVELFRTANFISTLAFVRIFDIDREMETLNCSKKD